MGTTGGGATLEDVTGGGATLEDVNGGGATLEGESEGWELLGVGLPWKCYMVRYSVLVGDEPMTEATQMQVYVRRWRPSTWLVDHTHVD